MKEERSPSGSLYVFFCSSNLPLSFFKSTHGTSCIAQNCQVAPIGIIGIYSGSALDDHAMIVSTLKHFFVKGGGSGVGGISMGGPGGAIPSTRDGPSPEVA